MDIIIGIVFAVTASAITMEFFRIFIMFVSYLQTEHKPPEKVKKPERVILFEIPAHRYCSHCDLRRGGCKIPECIGKYRSDGRDVIYKKVKI